MVEIQDLNEDELRKRIADTRNCMDSMPDTNWIIKDDLQRSLVELESELMRRKIARDFTNTTPQA